uniref:Uncharacterized protein n=1 Tax=Glossina austeni TaxID=7395 RepID=A0A1A9US71_GLOAU
MQMQGKQRSRDFASCTLSKTDLKSKYANDFNAKAKLVAAEQQLLQEQKHQQRKRQHQREQEQASLIKRYKTQFDPL